MKKMQTHICVEINAACKIVSAQIPTVYELIPLGNEDSHIYGTVIVLAADNVESPIVIQKEAPAWDYGSYRIGE